MKKYIIFDLDGTIIDTVDYMYSLILKECNKNNILFSNSEVINILNKNNGKGLEEVLKILFNSKSNIEITNILKNIIKNSIKHINKNIFNEGIYKLIKKLSKEYKLFLSSGNYDNYIKKVLIIGGLEKYFTLILGSDKITKSEKHLEYFKNHIKDDDFYNKTIYIGDGIIDEKNALTKKIDFIYIENKYSKGLVKNYIFKVNYIVELIDFFDRKYPKKIYEKEVLSNKYVKILQKDFINPDFTKSSYLIYGHNKIKTVGTFVIPITKNNNIIYIKEFRAGPEKEVISFPVGALEDNISEIENCKKELEEETGYTSNQIEYLGESIIENNFEGKSVYYIAKNCEKKFTQNLDKGEIIKVFEITINEFKKMIFDGKINFSKTVFGFLLAENKGYFNNLK